jgi:hypothetical protein
MDTDSDTEDDGGPTDAGVGLGETCMNSSDCQDYAADSCLTHPMSPGDPGYCTIQNCVAADCPEGWQCCDCDSLGWVIACMDDANAATATSMGCTCD